MIAFSPGCFTSDKTMKSSVNSVFRIWFWSHGNHLVHGDTTSKEIFIEEFVEGPENERSFLPEFADTVICNEVFTGYLREKNRKREICGGWVYLIRHLPKGGVLPPWSMALVKDAPSPTRSSFSKKQLQNELWMKFHDAYKWQSLQLPSVLLCSATLEVEVSSVPLTFNSDQLHHHCPDFYSSWKLSAKKKKHWESWDVIPSSYSLYKFY